MNKFVNSVNNVATTTVTENGDKTYSTSLNACVDLFFKIAAYRSRSDSDLIKLFNLAFHQDEDLATRILLWSRDIRGGAGERRSFRVIMNYLEQNHSDRLERILPLIPELGRWDDLFVVKTTKFKEQVLSMFAYALNDNNGLAAKWAPRESSSKKDWAKALREFMGLSERDYRKLIVSLSQTVEQKMCANQWDEINFSHVPSVASARYSKAFWKHQENRYREFINSAVKGEVKINSGAIFPHDILKNNVDNSTKNAMWKQLPDFIPEDVSLIPIIDTSASMTWTHCAPGVMPRDVAESLGLYMAERNKSAFKNLAMTFSDRPSWIKIPETDDVMIKINEIRRSSVGGSTNIDAAMDMIIDVAVKNNVAQSEMPKFLVIFSDMEFNNVYSYGSVPSSASERTIQKFKNAGYEMPNIVWWNIQSRNNSTPVRYDEKGMALVSGFSPSVAKSVLSGDLDPFTALLRTVCIERYDH